MTTHDIKLEAKSVIFYSKLDEECFFFQISKIAAIRRWFGELSSIFIICAPPPIDDESLRELTALFFRYGIETAQLDAYLSDANRSWFDHKNAYWRKRGVSERSS